MGVFILLNLYITGIIFIIWKTFDQPYFSVVASQKKIKPSTVIQRVLQTSFPCFFYVDVVGSRSTQLEKFRQRERGRLCRTYLGGQKEDEQILPEIVYCCSMLNCLSFAMSFLVMFNYPFVHLLKSHRI